MAESMKDYETELEASFKKIEEGDILTGTVISVDEKEVVVDLKYYAEGIIPAEDYSREPGSPSYLSILDVAMTGRPRYRPIYLTTVLGSHLFGLA